MPSGTWETTRPSLGLCGWGKKGALLCVEEEDPAALRPEPATVGILAPDPCAPEAKDSGLDSLAYIRLRSVA